MKDVFTLLKFQARLASWTHDQDALATIRRQVFIDEQHVSESDEWDLADDTAQHFLVYNNNGTPVACARLETQGKVSRMAVLPEYRQQGLGSLLLATVLKVALREKLGPIHLYAQQDARAFYEKYHFTAVGEPFMEAGIEHIAMRYHHGL